MTLDFILKAAVSSMIRGHHVPHCYSAHVPGRGYVNDGTVDRADYLRQLERSATSEAENVTYAPDYAEPGYHHPGKGIVFANWNTFPRGLDDILERAGYAVEWSDEWSTCDDCGRAVRTSGNSYGWQASYQLVNDCEIVCNDCIDWAERLEAIEDDPTQAVPRACDPAEHGYHRISEHESGWHPGQTDDPRVILKALHTAGKKGIVFRVSDVGQFDVHFETWQRDHDDA